jgi:putative ABC transport system ATP-binding protein
MPQDQVLAEKSTGASLDSRVIHLDRIHKIYHTGTVDVHALHGISLSVSRGEFLSIMGPSGSGKSTMMNIIGCLDRPTRGHYLLGGADVSTLSKGELADIRNSKIGFVFQAYNLIPRTTCLENVEMPMLYAGVHGAERIRRAREALAAVGIPEKEHSLPHQLSGGQQQRVAIARALVTEPAIILADEPTGNLDSRTSVEVLEIFQRLNRERGLTIIIVTHESDIAQYTKRSVLFRDGRIYRDYPVERQRDAREILAQLPAATDEEEEDEDEPLGNS